ncbi:hypothetical protein VHEMI00046 [[Torrubiella] hemipterigena]|uniref:CBM1 domain-containing protein n=1 Tax=[Torrubiella] hemipterigena TaxID=1531966 RepID=A0A0A1T3A5_9HYPO|nr:hypothetical protein VHEMI00046 [[Torrubiella] hemipterigena]
MKTFTVTVLALAAAAVATPTTPIPKCKPGTYRCQDNSQTHGPGWGVCDVSGNWVYGGDCPPQTVCLFNHVNGSPYCVPPGFHF